MIAKLVYTVLLSWLTFLLLRELWFVWRDPTLYIGQFDIVTESGKDDAAATNFPRRIVSAQTTQHRAC